jgi:hypothetical protein
LIAFRRRNVNAAPRFAWNINAQSRSTLGSSRHGLTSERNMAQIRKRVNVADERRAPGKQGLTLFRSVEAVPLVTGCGKRGRPWTRRVFPSFELWKPTIPRTHGLERHSYNVVFFADGPTLRLAPAFDQTSALYSPTADGQVPPRTFAPPHATADTLKVWDDVRTFSAANANAIG